MANEYLKYIHANIEEISVLVEAEFGLLSQDQINWKESDKRWSIAECLDHIIMTNLSYFPQFEALVRGDYKPTFWTRLPKSYQLFWASKLKERMTPQVTKRSISPPVFAPVIGQHDLSILKDFQKHQKALRKLILKLPDTPHDMIIIRSPAAGFITYPLRDAVEIISSHEMRHYNQAHRIKDLLGFPPE